MRRRALLSKRGGGIPRNGLVAEYLASGDALDTSGNGYNGTETAITYGADRHSVANSAFVLNGASSFVNIDAALSGLATNTKGTWSVWVKPTIVPPASATLIISFGDTDAIGEIQLQQAADGRIVIVSRIVGSIKWTLSSDASELSTDTWAHIALVQNAVIPILYIDNNIVAQGFLSETDKSVWFNDNTSLDNGRLGTLKFNSQPDSSYFNGSIDDIRLYDRDLSQAEITILANE